ncbi:MAG: hypothetical protein LBK73_04985 [Treponema sp.]|jgi:ABC-type sugar transport system ATPase subunit|nr:hypothetical protein [Treponema sp.]
MDNILEIKGLSKTYRHTHALIGVNVSVSEGSAEKDRSGYRTPAIYPTMNAYNNLAMQCRIAIAV